jgi:UrcA family protein
MTRLQMTLAFAAVSVLPFMPAVAKERAPDIQVSSSSANHGVRTAAVSYADLNLRSESGVAQLTSRVQSAVKQVCEPRNYSDLAQLRPTLTCRHSSMDRAKADIALAVEKHANTERTAAIASFQAVAPS